MGCRSVPADVALANEVPASDPSDRPVSIKEVRPAAAPGAHGYNVRYGRDPEKLYHSRLVHEQTELSLTALNSGERYWVAVDAFNENGVTAGTTVEARPA